jgi:superfamily II RNA helicase
MVKICAIDTYPADDEVTYSQYFEKYPYSLSIFQKYAIQGIVEGNHVLVTAHTGSGKTLACEFALEYFVGQGKKVIYTMPIKSLGNQKFHEFTQKYPHISFGLITGDIKLNPDAQVLIMTAEILLNKLYQPSKPTATANSSVSFNMDIQNELACVVMDEVHYINDKERGKTWEETIILLPPHIQMVMLSATIDAPERFAKWCESRHSGSGKSVYLASTYTRIVPLTHYAFIASPVALYKVLKDKTKEEELKKHVFNKMHTIQSHDGIFAEPTFHTINNTLKLLSVKDVKVKRSFVLNQVAKHMVDNNMLPALCFVLSRKMLEQCAQDITTSLLEDDSKVGYIVEQECEQIIRKLPNYKEYLNLPEYVKMVALLQKGIAIHHAGVMPVIREMVELLYGKGYIKLLFATETFAVGINMPTKTVLFTDICKFDGAGNRPLHSHEYTQMAGRAGRRGIDDVGNVIHLPNLYRNFELTGLRNMLKGTAQQLTSKFKISYNLIFNQISQCDAGCTVGLILNYIYKSMAHDEMEREIGGINWQLAELQEEIDHLQTSFAHLRTPADTIQTYLRLLAQRPGAVNKKRKDIDREIQQIMDDYKFIDKDKATVIKFNEKVALRLKTAASLANAEQYIANNVRTIMRMLVQSGHIDCTKATKYAEDGEQEDYDLYTLTQKGSYATHLKEINCLTFSQLYADGAFNKLSALQIVMVFSCFTNATVSDECKSVAPNSGDTLVDDLVGTIFSSLQTQLKEETDQGIHTGTAYDIHYDLLHYVAEWWDCQTEPDCKRVLQRIEAEKGIFLGEFVKALLKINNVSTEFEQIAEQVGDIETLHKLQSIPSNTLKFIATNQSLYV